jgi:ethanolamine permease
MKESELSVDVGALQQDAEYFAKRQLKKGAVGWLLLVGLGVSYVISGDFAGWNFGLAQGGWGGLFIATVIVAFMYLCMSFVMSEMSTMLPTAGGGYSFARVAFGPFGGYLTGTAILIEYAIAPAAIAVFIGSYCQSLFGVGGWAVYLICYLVLWAFISKVQVKRLKSCLELPPLLVLHWSYLSLRCFHILTAHVCLIFQSVLMQVQVAFAVWLYGNMGRSTLCHLVFPCS